MKQDEGKTKIQLITELQQARKQIAEIEGVKGNLNQQEEKSHNAEANLKNIYNISPGLICAVNAKTGYITECNPAVTSILGFSVEEFKSMPFMEFVHSDDIQRTVDEIAKQLKGSSVASFENRYRCRDGSYKWLAWQATKADKNGKMYSFAADITKRKQAEEELLQQKHDLGERVKELNCLYGISRLVENPDITLNKIIQGTVDLIPPSWQYPEITCARIFIIGQKFETLPFKETSWKQSALIKISNEESGILEIFYMEEKPEIYEGPFLKEERNLLNAIAERLGRTIERKQAQEELKKSHKKLRNLAIHLLSIREEERINIAREIHDELGQLLTALKMDIYWLYHKMPKGSKTIIDKKEIILDIINSAIQSVQRITRELRPGLLDDLSLSAAIEWEINEFRKRSGMECKVLMIPEEIKIKNEYSIVAYRILQETLTNIMRHSNATKVNVVLKMQDNKIILVVKDNGIGITEKELSSPHSFGIIGMRERCLALGGEILFIRNKGSGTEVIANFNIK